MSTERSLQNAAHMLTTLSLRPDLATRVPTLHLGLQRDYQRWLDLQRRRRALAAELAACEAHSTRLTAALSKGVSAARFALSDNSKAGVGHRNQRKAA
ncbi:MAG: hypothetical protein CMP23_03000 [Rickettsiales bacterium]|nr:hypothetical protein [Rickettsiales bacterium]|tara:strand:+ start:1287 stop:1580 length:294 start_codon:yes stop_codon:yes gene_type:complete